MTHYTSHTESFSKIAAALAKAQASILPAKKSQLNTHFNRSYADLTEIVEACRMPLAEAGICRLQSVCETPEGLVLETYLIHGESGEYFMSRYPIEPAAKTAQQVGAAITYAKRFALAAMVGVVSEDEDDDGESLRKGSDGEDASDPAIQQSGAEKAAAAAARQFVVSSEGQLNAMKTVDEVKAWEEKNAKWLARLSRFEDDHAAVMKSLNAAYERVGGEAV